MRQDTRPPTGRQPARSLTIERKIMSNRHARAFVSAHTDSDERSVILHLPPADRLLTEGEREDILKTFRKWIS